MKYAGVLFDLFGTLVAPFRKREHRAAIVECAGRLGIDPEECHRHWVETFPRRIRGDFGSVDENFAWIVARTGREPSPEALADAGAIYRRFTAEGLEPAAGATAMLERLRERGVRIGLVSNCAPDIPIVWEGSRLAPHVDYCAFSCRVGAVKPDAALYRAALDALDLPPARTLYVGDGSDEELSGAARCGMDPVLVAADLTNTYDAVRTDVEGWRGRTIDSLAGVTAIVEGG